MGPWIGGLISDAYGNYTPLLIAGFVGCWISAALIITLGPYPKWERERAS